MVGPHHIGSCDPGDKTKWQGFVVKGPPPRGDTDTIGLLVRKKRRSDNHGRGRGVALSLSFEAIMAVKHNGDGFATREASNKSNFAFPLFDEGRGTTLLGAVTHRVTL